MYARRKYQKLGIWQKPFGKKEKKNFIKIYIILARLKFNDHQMISTVKIN